ncbi:MAG: hypothetical protein CSA07_02995, partial [Bacteroidia bacterium]
MEATSILGMERMNLKGCGIIEPVGAKFSQAKKAVVDRNGSVVKGRVVIDKVVVKHTVTIHLGRGTLPDGRGGIITEKVEHGKRLADPGTPTQAGYEFLGWLAEKPGMAPSSFTFAESITDDLTIVAVWQKAQPKEHTVTFDLDGGKLPDGRTGTFTERIKHRYAVGHPGTPTKKGHTFKGWFKLGERAAYVFATTRVTEDITIKAKWEVAKPTTHWVSVNLDGGELPGRTPGFSQEVRHGEVMADPGVPTKDGFDFLGWVGGAPGGPQGPFTFSTKIVSDMRVVAVWKAKGSGGGGGTAPVTHTVTFELDGGELGSKTGSFTKTVEHGEAVDNPGEPTKSGYTFKGWFKSGAEYKFDAPVTEDITITAQWESAGGSGGGGGTTPVTHTVTFDLGGGELNGKTDDITKTVEHDK